jgi:hypothetical protein
LGLSHNIAAFREFARNAQFPRALTTDYQGGETWDADAIVAFAGVRSRAWKNGHRIMPDRYRFADWRTLAATRPTGKVA